MGVADGVAELIGDGSGNFGVRKGVGCGDGVVWGDGLGTAACGDGVGHVDALGLGACVGCAGVCFGALGCCDGGCCPSAKYAAAKPITSHNESFISGLNGRCWPMRVK